MPLSAPKNKPTCGHNGFASSLVLIGHDLFALCLFFFLFLFFFFLIFLFFFTTLNALLVVWNINFRPLVRVA